MLIKKWIFCIAMLCLLPFAAAAKPATAPERCLTLGAHPALMIKFSNTQSPLASGILSRLSSDMATFTYARPLANQTFLVFFTPQNALLEQQIRPGCYPQQAINDLINHIKTKANIRYAIPNVLHRATDIKKIAPISSIQWDLLTPPGGIEANLAHTTTTGSTNAITAVIDTGMLTNTSLTPNLLTGATFNNSGAYIAEGAAPSCNVSSCGYEHGTHVAGSVSASGVLAYGRFIFGVAPTSKLLPINVFTKFTETADCAPDPAPCLLSATADIVNAWLWLNGETFTEIPNAPYVTTINMSLGSTSECSEALQADIDALLAKNISFAIAAGNANTDAGTEFPANCAGVMTVAATGPAGFGAPYSNYGAIVSFAAPGGDATNGEADEIYSTIENGYGYLQGTSMASPHVAGLSALLYSVDPTLTPALVKSIIADHVTAFPPGNPNPSQNCVLPDKPCGTGIINANLAVLAAVAQAPTLTWPATPTVNPSSDEAIITWDAATWTPTRTTAIHYTVNVDGADVATCTDIATTSCTIPNLTAHTAYTVIVNATDVRNIHAAVPSTPVIFTTLTTLPPTLTVAERNPFITTQAFLYYSHISALTMDSYTVNGITGGASVTLDTTHQRFVVSGITTPKQIDNVSITATYGIFSKTSNSITIPSIL